MSNFVFRNYTLEYLFGKGYSFSDYNSSLVYDKGAENYFWFYQYPVKENSQSIINELDDLRSRLNLLVSDLEESKTLYLFTIEFISNFSFINSNLDLVKSVEDYNNYLEEIAKSRSNTYLIDIRNFYRKYNSDDIIDWKFYYTSQIIINPKLGRAFKKWLHIQIDAINFKRKKCLVLDLDNTLWGGILGEDGQEGIACGNAYPGNIYRDFQNLIKEASKTGIILAVCSKNNDRDVLEVWDKHPELVLRKNDFAAYRINWNNKAQNITELSHELNIGLDSMVFIDDNPVEREIVRTAIPEINVPEFPDKNYLLPQFFRDVYEQYFQVYKVNNEDVSKLEQYKTNAKRAELKANLDIDQYLRSLDTEITIEKANKYTVPRIAQMTQKTNQFNLTTKRYTESDIRNLIDNGSLIYTLSVKDKFGDSGITGLVIFKPIEQLLRIDALLLSCRVLGRDIEFTFIKSILNQLYNRFTQIESQYIPTLKNRQVEFYFEKIGFEISETIDEGGKRYSYLLKEKFEIDDKIKVEYNG